LACWDKFFVHNPLDIKESDDHAHDIAFHLSGLFLALVMWGFSTGTIVALCQGLNRKPSFITSDDPGQGDFITGGELTKFVQMLTCCCFWSAVRILGTNLAATRCMPNSSVRTRWHVP
jgi:hypothetical protein